MTKDGTVTIEMHPLDIAVLKHALAVARARARRHCDAAGDGEKAVHEHVIRNINHVYRKLDLLGAADVTMTTHD